MMYSNSNLHLDSYNKMIHLLSLLFDCYCCCSSVYEASSLMCIREGIHHLVNTAIDSSKLTDSRYENSFGEAKLSQKSIFAFNHPVTQAPFRTQLNAPVCTNMVRCDGAATCNVQDALPISQVIKI